MAHTIGITMGDPAGIGPEVLVKALNAFTKSGMCAKSGALADREKLASVGNSAALGKPENLPEDTAFLIIGDGAAIRDALEFTGVSLEITEVNPEAEKTPALRPGSIGLLDLKLLAPGSWKYGLPQPSCGEASFRYIEKAAALAMNGSLDGIVTAPINKEALNMGGRRYSGHTEILGELTGTKNFAMLLVCGNLRVIHVTTHVSMEEACRRITRERVLDVIRLAREGTGLLGVDNPRIAVAGFNPHCSENGLFGDQEEKAIIPAIRDALSEGLAVEGPIPGDSVFVKALAGQYDAVVAMYHDQGHIPLKLVGFRLDSGTNKYTALGGINCTIGLPIIRTSVDHGTAYDRAGKNLSNEQSLVEAIQAAVTMAGRREKKNGF